MNLLRFKYLIGALCLLFWAGGGFAQQPAAAESIRGRPQVIDGDTIVVRQTRIWLYGIDAPEKKQKCQADGREWSCGRAAKTVLKQAIGRKRVACVSRPVGDDGNGDRRDLVLAVCRAGPLILNEWMVKMGWAIAYRPHGSDYVDAERSAKEKRLGIWNGTFIKPREWRRQKSE